jgi:hypothetical protein
MTHGPFPQLFCALGGFNSSQAVALSNVTIVGGAMANFIINVQRRHPLVSTAPLIDWALILVRSWGRAGRGGTGRRRAWRGVVGRGGGLARPLRLHAPVSFVCVCVCVCAGGFHRVEGVLGCSVAERQAQTPLPQTEPPALLRCAFTVAAAAAAPQIMEPTTILGAVIGTYANKVRMAPPAPLLAAAPASGSPAFSPRLPHGSLQACSGADLPLFLPLSPAHCADAPNLCLQPRCCLAWRQ